MKRAEPILSVEHPDRILSYFRLEKRPLALVAVSGILYNVGLAAGPYFEGQLAQRLLDVMQGRETLSDMARLAGIYLLVILAVQLMRCVKRFYVRRFANDTSRNMRHMLYNNLVWKTRRELEEESVGTVMTKAVSDVDACAEGMRKFTTEIFDTGIALAVYLGMLFFYDWRLALLSCLFTPVAYLIADRLKETVARCGAACKKSAGQLNDSTLDRVSNALTYRIFGLETARSGDYDVRLADYEQKSVAANIWENTMQPIYNIISMGGAVLILYFGARNVLGTGWTVWNIAAFTTFLSCFSKMALKSSKAAKLFNSVQKAQVSWRRIKPLMQPYTEPDLRTDLDFSRPCALELSHLTLTLPDGRVLLHDFSLSARPGEIIGVAGPVASGKSALGRIFLGEVPYRGSIRIGTRELTSLSGYERSRLISYSGHRPELMSGTIAENIALGEAEDVFPYLRAVCLDREVLEMPEQENTPVGSGGIRLSGGQQSRLALARALCHGGKILVLDDPFSAVDRITETEILQNLRSFARDRIILLISHRLLHFPDLDKVIWLADGQAQAGTHESLAAAVPAYARLFETQKSGGERDEA